MNRNIQPLKMYIYWGKNFVAVIYSKILLLFGIKKSISIIPEGLYCYTPDYEKNKMAESFTYYIIPCKYYKIIGKRWNGCEYLGIITDDFLFDDQCKMCGENYSDDNIS